MTRFACAVLLGACWTDEPGDANAATAPSCPESIVDTLGNEWAFDCDDPGAAFQERRMPNCRGDETFFFALHPSERLLRVCRFEGDPEGGGSVSAFECRPIACASRADCTTGYTCSNGLCQIPTQPVTGEDALVLCLSDIAWLDECMPLASDPDPAPGPRIEALEACLEDDEAPCRVPSICRQP